MESDFELAFKSAEEIRQIILSKQISPIELVRYFLKRIEKLNPVLNAYLDVYPELALKRAREVEQRVMEGDTEGCLLGVPIAVDDGIRVKSTHLFKCCKALEIPISRKNSIAVENLYKEGAIILGKTNASEYGLSSMAMNSLAPPTANPWNTSFSSGGSCGGGAAAVAAGLATMALGIDKSGGVRYPASCCGVYSIKAARGAVPFVENYTMTPSKEKLLQHAAIARNPSDLARVLSTLTSSEMMSFNKAMDMGKNTFKIASIIDFEFLPVDIEVKEAYEQLLDAFKEQGSVIEEVQLNMGLDLYENFITLFSTDHYVSIMSAYNMASEVEDDVFELYTKNWFERAKSASAIDYSIGQTYLSWIESRFNDLFKRYDLILTPATPTTVVPIGADSLGCYGNILDNILSLWSFLLPFNMSGHPAMTIPLTLSSGAGLPISVQVVSQYGAENLLFQFASHFSSTIGGIESRPNLGSVTR